jgi:two-component system response regulator
MATPVVFSLEDNDGDFALVELVLQQCLDRVDLRRVSDGEQAIAFLKQSETSVDQPRPDLILLDINTPRMNGFDVLAFIKSQEFIRDVPVVMLSSSRNAREEKKALELGAEQFLTKPTTLDGMLKTLNEVCAKYLKPSDTIV